ncbi:His/Gly/Thr/Pro-type tRNA ligase C-terminal domain-containing protein [Clostridium malenominatum]
MKSLQEKGFGVTIYFEDDSLKKKMSYASKLRVEYVILIGEDEVLREKDN